MSITTPFKPHTPTISNTGIIKDNKSVTLTSPRSIDSDTRYLILQPRRPTHKPNDPVSLNYWVTLIYPTTDPICKRDPIGENYPRNRPTKNQPSTHYLKSTLYMVSKRSPSKSILSSHASDDHG